MRNPVTYLKLLFSEAYPLEKIVYLFVLVLTLTGIVITFIDPDYFKQAYVVEDGLIESLTVLGLLLGFGLCVYRIFTLYAHRGVLFTLMTTLLALMLFFVAGEEISWGQRMLGTETPEWFMKYNAQEETNLHNLTIDGKKIHKPIFTYGFGGTMIIYLFVITPLYKRKPALARFLDRLAVPIAKPHHVAAYLLLYILVEALVFSSKRGEMLEFGVVFLFFLNLAFPFNRHIFSHPRND